MYSQAHVAIILPNFNFIAFCSISWSSFASRLPSAPYPSNFPELVVGMVGERRLLVAPLPISVRESTLTPKVVRPARANAISDPVLSSKSTVEDGVYGLDDSVRSYFAAAPTDDIGTCSAGRARF